MKGKIKKYVALVLSVQQLLCGCSATELEDRCFPMMAVVDEKDGQISFGYGFPKLSQKDNTDLEEARVNIAPVTGKTMESCVQTYDSRLEKLADCNHMKVLVFGENLMEDTGRYADVLSYLKQTGLFPRNIYVCVAEDPLALFETEEDLPQDLGSYLEQYLQNQESAGSGKLFKLGRLLDEKENHILQIMLPYLETEDHIIFWKTMYRVPDDRFCINRKNNGNALTIRGKRVWENEKEKNHVYHFMYVNGSCCGNCARNRKEKGGPTAAGNCRKNTAVSCTGKQ